MTLYLWLLIQEILLKKNTVEDIDEDCVMILKSIPYPSLLYPDENDFDFIKSSKSLSTYLFPLTVVKVLKTGSRAEQLCLYIYNKGR